VLTGARRIPEGGINVLKRVAVSLGVGLVSIGLVVPAALAHAAVSARATDTAGHVRLVRLQRELGYLPIGNDFAQYERNVDARYRAWQASYRGPVAVSSGTSASAPSAPVNVPGQSDDRLAPGDPTGAAGPQSYIQFINDKMAIYSRTGSLINEAGTASFTAAGGSDTDYSDPQILWDATTNRFYYLIIRTADDTFAWGFSKNANPQTISTDFCNYTADFGYGLNLPDYPKLGDSTDFLLIGANIYAVEAYVGSDIDWIAKPKGQKAITTCPAASTFRQGMDTAIKNADGSSFASDPNPAQQADPSSTGWVAAVPDETNSGAAGNFLTVFPVTKNADGTANIPNVGTQVSVSNFAPPPPAPQMGTNFTLDSLDGRLTHAVSSVDPATGRTALWTGHTIAGGAGSEYRWYKIDVANATLFGSGDVTDPNLFVLNGSIASDRLVRVTKRGVQAKFGSNAVIGFTTTGPQALPAAQMVSVKGANPASSFVLVFQSPGPDNGFDCTENPFVPDRCRWGDYAGASSDPGAAPKAPEGRVWLDNMTATGGATPDPLNPTWGTRIWQAAA
jgi:hypothetical protein